MTDRESILEAVREALANDQRVAVALVFGSVARGSHHAGSDVDLAVRTAGDANLYELSGSLAGRLRREVDIVRLDDVTVPLREAILRDGVVVHEGRRGAAAEWWSRALADRETDGPWYRRMRDAWLSHVAKMGVGDGRR